jgi:hypothetical protein
MQAIFKWAGLLMDQMMPSDALNHEREAQGALGFSPVTTALLAVHRRGRDVQAFRSIDRPMKSQREFE